MKTITLEQAYKLSSGTPFRKCGFSIVKGSGHRNVIADTYMVGSKDKTNANAALLAHAFNVLPEVVEALKELAECSPCKNGCAKDDMTCASNRARAALTKANQVKLPE